MNRVCADGIVCAAATLSVAEEEEEEEEGRIIEGRIVCACDDGRGEGGGCLGTSWYISDAARKKVGLPVKLPVSIERV